MREAPTAPRMVSPTKPIRRCPSDSRYLVAIRPPATSSVSVCGTPGVGASMVTSGTPASRKESSCGSDSRSDTTITPSARCRLVSAARW